MQLSPLLQIRKQAQRAAAAYLRSHSYQVGAARSQFRNSVLSKTSEDPDDTQLRTSRLELSSGF